MTEVTRILSAIEHGDPAAAEQLLPLVYDEPADDVRTLNQALNQLAGENPLFAPAVLNLDGVDEVIQASASAI